MIERIEMTDGRRPVGVAWLSDPGSLVIDRYGLRNAGTRRGIPHPAVYIIDRDGIVRWKFIEVNYKIRPTNEIVRGALTEVLSAR